MQNNGSRVNSFIKNNLGYVFILIGFILLVIFLKKSFYGVPWMDQVNLFADKIPDFYSGHIQPKSIIYDHQYQLFPSVIFANYLNARLFGLNNKVFIVLVMLVVLATAIFLYRKFNYLFDAKYKWLYAAIVALFLFNPIRWEAMLPSDFGVFLIAYASVNVALIYYAHKYYFTQNGNKKQAAFFLAVFIIFSIIDSIDNGGFFLPYLSASLLFSIINFFTFKDEIIKKRWWQITSLTVFFIFFAIFANNYLHNKIFSADVATGYSSGFLNLLIHSPWYVIKFFAISNTGNFFTFELYAQNEFLKAIVPYLGLGVLLLYGICIYHYIKARQKQLLFFILLILATLSYYFFILVARTVLSDGNVYYGASSRYGGTTLFGMVGVCSAILLLLSKNNFSKKILKYVSLTGMLILFLFATLSFEKQYEIAHYRKASLWNMGLAYKRDSNLELLQAQSVEKAQVARSFMLLHNLGVFRPGKKLTTYGIDCNFKDIDYDGFYGIEQPDKGGWRWTNGESDIILPNLYAVKDSLYLTIRCYMPGGDTAKVIINDDLSPVSVNKTDMGFKYTFALLKPTVLFRIRLSGKSIIPHEKDSTSMDQRRLGFIFNNLNLENR